MRKKTIIYCVYCGTKNKIDEKRCIKCHKRLDPKDHSFFSFLLENGKSDLKDYVAENIFDFLKTFLVEHLYGTVFVVSVLFTTTSIVLQNIANNDITYVDKVLVQEKQKIVETEPVKEMEEEKVPEAKEIVAASKVCDSGYLLQNDQCFYRGEVAADVHYSCSDSSYQYNSTAQKCLLFAVAGKVNSTCSQTDESKVQYGYGITHVDKDTGKCILQYDDNGTQKSVEIDSPIKRVVLCDSGNYRLDDNCYYSQDPITSYSCSSGTLNGDKCIVEQVKKYHYDCPEGYHLIQNNQCEKDS